MICEACGESNRPGTEFCAFCGSYLAWDPAAAAAAERTDRDQRPPGAASAPAATAPTSVAPTRSPAADAPPPAPVAAPPVSVPPPQAPAYVAVAEPAEAPCPACGRPNPPGRRFCARCGHRLLADTSPAATRPVVASSAGSRDRAARREYRRSLPPLYRWRRVLVVLGLVAGLVVGLAVAGRDPVGFVVARYHDVRGTLVVVPVTATAVEPPDATVPKSNPAALTDRTEAAWTMRWTPAAAGASCGGAPGTGVVVLTIAPTRVRALSVTAGLLASNGRRPLQARPLVLGVSFDGGACQRLELTDVADEQVLAVDSTSPVSTIRIGVDAAAPQREDGEPVLSFTEIGVRARPR